VPIVGAAVQILGPDGDKKLTDSKGTVQFYRVPAQKIHVSIEKTGYESLLTVLGPLEKDRMIVLERRAQPPGRGVVDEVALRHRRRVPPASAFP
jgi:hypothetical protein